MLCKDLKDGMLVKITNPSSKGWFNHKTQERLFGDSPFVDTGVWDVGEIDIAIGRHGRTFGELEPTGQLDRIGPGRDEVCCLSPAWPSDGYRNQ